MRIKKYTSLLLIAIDVALSHPVLRFVDIAAVYQGRSQQAGRWISPDEVVPEEQNPDAVKYVQERFLNVTNPSLPFVRSCIKKDPRPQQCQTQPQPALHPALPLPDDYRNVLLGRPPPEVVRKNIEEATNGDTSTVNDLVNKAIANLENIEVLSESELTVLASNFHRSKPGWLSSAGCTLLDRPEWPEDLIIAEDELRALTAAFLFLYGHAKYQERREEELRELIRRHAEERQVEGCGGCKEATKASTDTFLDGVGMLDCGTILMEDEWWKRFNAFHQDLRTSLHTIAGADRRTLSEAVASSLEKVFFEAEEAAEADLCRRLPVSRPGFSQYLAEQKQRIEQQFPGIRPCYLHRLAFHRWIAKSEADRLPYSAAETDICPRI